VNVVAVVVAGGSRSAGAAVDVLRPVAGVPMLVRSVRAVLACGLVDHVMIDGGERTSALLHACAGLPVRAWQPRLAPQVVRAHSGQRADATSGDGAGAERFDGFVVAHDAARPLTPPALFGAVLEAVRHGHEVAVPVLPLADTVKTVDGDGLVRGTPDRAGLRVVQTPHAFRAGAVHTGLLDVAGAHTAAGRPVHTVVGDPLAFAVRTPWDLQLAELLVEGA
jgi:2-C-methyl-D-erythritol 4-phosphate cytidylyltransferase